MILLLRYFWLFRLLTQQQQQKKYNIEATPNGIYIHTSIRKY